MPDPVLSTATETTVLDRSDESPTDLLYRAAVGPISADYYLPLFARFESAGRAGLSWNWAACCYTLNWMAFRSLWVAALAYVGLMLFVPLVVFGLGRLVLQLSETAELVLLVGWGVLSFLVPGMAGNAVLWSDLHKRMTRAITNSKTLSEACAILASQASSRQRLIGLGVVNLLWVAVVLGFYLAVPQDGMLARVQPDAAPARLAESGLVVDLTTTPAPVASAAASVSSVPVPMTVPASEPLPASPPAPAPTPILVEPAPSPKPSDEALALAAVSVSSKVFKPYVINVGLFAQEANARKAKAILLEAGLSPLAQEVDTRQGKRTRLRVGPFNTRAQAEVAAEKIRLLKLEAQVFRP